MLKYKKILIFFINFFILFIIFCQDNSLLEKNIRKEIIKELNKERKIEENELEEYFYEDLDILENRLELNKKNLDKDYSKRLEFWLSEIESKKNEEIDKYENKIKDIENNINSEEDKLDLIIEKIRKKNNDLINNSRKKYLVKVKNIKNEAKKNIKNNEKKHKLIIKEYKIKKNKAADENEKLQIDMMIENEDNIFEKIIEEIEFKENQDLENEKIIFKNKKLRSNKECRSIIKRKELDYKKNILEPLNKMLNDIENEYELILYEISDKKEEIENILDEEYKKNKELLEKEYEMKINNIEEKYNQEKELRNTKEGMYIILLRKVSMLNSIISALDERAITFVTNGTRINRSRSIEEYYFSLDDDTDSEKFADEVAHFLKSKKGFYLKWRGDNNDKARRDAAENFLPIIINKIKISAEKYNISQFELPINLVGHSHGGNIMILLANILEEKGYNVQLLFTMSTPVREYQLKYNIKHIQLYSYSDKYQKIGGWDFDWLWYDLDYSGPGKRKFKNALNINIAYYLDNNTEKFFKEKFKKIYPASSNYPHQITRYIGLLKKIISGKLNLQAGI